MGRTMFNRYLMHYRAIIAASISLAPWSGFTQVQMTQAEGRDARPMAAQKWLCSASSNPDWQKIGCRDSAQCRARCVPILSCTDANVRAALAKCAGQSNCRPLIVHRALDRLGCTFAADEFWVAPDAQLKGDPVVREGIVSTQWEPSSCRDTDLSDIRNGLRTLKARDMVYAELMRRGCRVDLLRKRSEEPFTDVALAREPAMYGIGVGPQAQPELLVDFKPAVLPPVPWSSTPICDVLGVLHGNRRFAECGAPGDARDVYLKVVEIGERGIVRIRVERDVVPPPSPQPPPPPLSPAAAAGAAGAGALLLALARWLYRLLMKGRPVPEEDEPADRLQDITVVASLLEPYQIEARTNGAKPGPDNPRS